MLTVGSLFAGIGGMDLGLESEGFETVFQVEMCPHASAVLARHWPDVTRMGDIRKVETFPTCDVLAGGFPCQDISIANKTAKGIEGEKSGLWAEFFRAIKQVRPKYVIVENVTAIRYRGRGLDRVLRDLASIGYDAEWQVLPASIEGAPHKRARFWLVAYPHRDRKPDGALDGQAHIMSEPRGADRAWPDPPEGLRVDDGFSRRLDGHRLRQLGNAIVPAAAARIARCVRRDAIAHDLWNTSPSITADEAKS